MAENDRSYDSENVNKRIKSNDEEEEEDRISSLPDFLIHHILSLLPATDLVKTMVLSKWWNYQWTHVPVLNFIPNAGMSPDQFSNFIDKTLILHDCSNLHKFVINLNPFSRDDEFPDLDLWIRFAVRKDVKELIVNFNNDIYHHPFPQFVFNCSSLIKLELFRCYFVRIEKVNWGSVKSLCLHDCALWGIAKVVSGSPLLEHLELQCCDLYKPELVIASKSLKTLVMDSIGNRFDVIEISCPNVERLRVSGLACFPCLKLMNLPSSVYATLDFYIEEEDFDEDMSYDDYENLVLQTLMQVLHVEKLEIGSWLMEILSSSKEDGDCIGGLPDSFIHRIISFLPSTKDAFKSDCYKCWRKKWSDDVPILKFVSNEKFIIDSKDIPLRYLDPRLSLWIRFAARKDVKELILDCDGANVESGYEYPLPKFLFNNSSLVKMKLSACDFMPNGKVNWESLKSLILDHSELGDQAIEHVLSGSPLLERLELYYCGFQGAVIVASEHLKTFIVEDFDENCQLLQISCPKLESLKIWGNMYSTCLHLKDLPSSLHATLDLYILESDDVISADDCMNLLEETMEQVLHVEELEVKLSWLNNRKSGVVS